MLKNEKSNWSIKPETSSVLELWALCKLLFCLSNGKEDWCYNLRWPVKTVVWYRSLLRLSSIEPSFEDCSIWYYILVPLSFCIGLRGLLSCVEALFAAFFSLEQLLFGTKENGLVVCSSFDFVGGSLFSDILSSAELVRDSQPSSIRLFRCLSPAYVLRLLGLVSLISFAFNCLKLILKFQI